MIRRYFNQGSAGATFSELNVSAIKNEEQVVFSIASHASKDCSRIVKLNAEQLSNLIKLIEPYSLFKVPKLWEDRP